MPPSSTDLRKLYVDDGLTTREIGPLYGVAHITVRRWLTKYAIPVRPTGRGLANRGIEAPTAAELDRLVNVERLTYQQIGQRYGGVNKTAVMHWLRNHGIAQTPRITVDELRERYLAGESAEAIAASVGCTKGAILNRLRTAGIDRRPTGWRSPLLCKAGCLVRSTYEQRVADWLTEHGVSFEYEPDVPFGHGNTRADFFANGWYIEIWGVHSRASYMDQKRRKQEGYAAHDLPLIELSPHHFARDVHILERRLRQTLQAP